MERCIGCFLCVLEAGKSAGEISLDHSLIRILTRGKDFIAEIDTGRPAPEKVVAICPRNCLAITEG